MSELAHRPKRILGSPCTPRRFLRLGMPAFLSVLFLQPLAMGSTPERIELHRGWSMPSSRPVTQAGDVISTTEFKPSGWYEAKVPSTVLAVQVARGEFKDPYFSDNLRKIPGTTYPVGAMFSRMPTPKDSPYASSWWYRTEFRLPQDYRGRVVWLHFDGINKRANIWVNGRKLADAKDVAGAFRIYEFNATDFLHPDAMNVLALERRGFRRTTDPLWHPRSPPN